MKILFTILSLFSFWYSYATDSLVVEPPLEVAYKSAEFPGGEQQMQEFIHNNLNFPDSLQRKDLEGFVFVQFEVEKDGSLGHMKIEKSLHTILDIEAIRVLEKMPPWIPAREGNNTLKETLILPIEFNVANVRPEPEDNNIFLVADVMPKYVGGADSMYTFIGRNFKWTPITSKLQVQGKVIVRFVVEKDGSLSHLEVIKKLQNDLDKEALNVISKMPAWIPAKHNGKYVRCAYMIPVTFTM